MTFEPLSDRFVHHLAHSLALPAAPVPPASSPTSTPPGLLLSEVPDQPLSWLWPGRLPLGHLTLLDAAPGCDPSLLALTLAACISSGKPLPGGTPTLPANVILYAPCDSPSATLKPRLQAAGGDPTHVLLFRPPGEETSRANTRAGTCAFPRDLDALAHAIRRLDAHLVILDPAGAIPGLSRSMPALCELAQQTNCAILLTRSLPHPPADPLRSCGPASPVQEAARSRLLLIPDPADERHALLLTTRHSLSAPPPILAYDLLFSDAGIPTIHWLAERDHAHLARLSTGPLHSPHRQAILRFLHHSPSPRSIPDILAATCYDPQAGRAMLTRMKLAGELVCTARGLYTTSAHPSLASLANDPPPISNVADIPSQGTGGACPRPGFPVPTVAIVADMPAQGTGGACPRPGILVPTVPTPPTTPDPTESNSPQSDTPSPPAFPIADHPTGPIPSDSPVTNVTNPTDTIGLSLNDAS